jgi:pyrroline-5-carboxylate reductase
MAKAVLLNGKDPALRRLAQEIVVTQGQEIDVMRLRLAAFEKPATGDTQQVSQKSSASTIATLPYSHDRVYTGDKTSNVEEQQIVSVLIGPGGAWLRARLDKCPYRPYEGNKADENPPARFAAVVPLPWDRFLHVPATCPR